MKIQVLEEKLQYLSEGYQLNITKVGQLSEQLFFTFTKGNAQIRMWLVNDCLIQRAYLRDGLLHRESKEGPAVEDFYFGTDCVLQKQTYFLNGHTHRPFEEGPAGIAYHSSGDVICADFFVNGRFIKTEWGEIAGARDAVRYS